MKKKPIAPGQCQHYLGDAQCKYVARHGGAHFADGVAYWESKDSRSTTARRDAHEAVRTLLKLIGEDPDREGLRDTPARSAKAWLELTQGYLGDPAQILERDFDGAGYDQMIMTRRLQVISMCEHHMLPFYGHAWIGYVPRQRVVGVSKMSRLLKCYMRRLQIQERLTMEVAEAMMEHLKPKGVGVMVAAAHMCMTCRGVMEPESDMVTTELLGCFKRPEVRAEFLGRCV